MPLNLVWPITTPKIVHLMKKCNIWYSVLKTARFSVLNEDVAQPSFPPERKHN